MNSVFGVKSSCDYVLWNGFICSMYLSAIILVVIHIPGSVINQFVVFAFVNTPIPDKDIARYCSDYLALLDLEELIGDLYIFLSKKIYISMKITHYYILSVSSLNQLPLSRLQT